VTGRGNQIRRKGHPAFMRALNRFAELGGNRLLEKQSTQKEEGLMEESKRKEIEARLFQLFAQNDQDKNKKQLTQNISSGVKVIRRRKGKPDLHIS
jgi:hypothetical protein